LNLECGVMAVAVINTPISAELTRQDLVAREIPLSSVAAILLREVDEPWLEQCAIVVRYPGKPAHELLGQWRFVGFYRAAARLLRGLEKYADLRDIYLVNNDNLITSHLLSVAECLPSITATSIVEGTMNFHEIGIVDRAGWRWQVKPAIARIFGFRYRQPKGHLSGAYEPRVSRVISFAAEGLKAPPEKVVLRQLQAIRPLRQSDPKVALIMLTNWETCLAPALDEFLARSFVEWVEGSGYRKIQVKKHPRWPGGRMEALLDRYEEVGSGLTAEEMVTNLEAGTIIGTFSTALVSMKLIRPDLNCIDYGSDFYCEHAYHGDDSVKTLFSASGITLVQMAAPQPQRWEQIETQL
jgi:Alpha-2,8-polysialyltransferase (POLYST)